MTWGHRPHDFGTTERSRKVEDSQQVQLYISLYRVRFSSLRMTRVDRGSFFIHCPSTFVEETDAIICSKDPLSWPIEGRD